MHCNKESQQQELVFAIQSRQSPNTLGIIHLHSRRWNPNRLFSAMKDVMWLSTKVIAESCCTEIIEKIYQSSLTWGNWIRHRQYMQADRSQYCRVNDWYWSSTRSSATITMDREHIHGMVNSVRFWGSYYYDNLTLSHIFWPKAAQLSSGSYIAIG